MRTFETKNRYTFIKIIGIVLFCALIISMSYSFTSAWFRDESTTSNGEPNIMIVGDIDLEVVTNFKINNLAFAPDTIYTRDKNNQEIKTTLRTSVDHDIDGAYVRIKFTTNRSELTLYFDGNTTNSANYNAGSDRNKWFYNTTDGYWYYVGVIVDTPTMFNAGYAIDNTLRNEIAGANVELDYKVEAIQRQYDAYVALWTTAPNVFVGFAQADKSNSWGRSS